MRAFLTSAVAFILQSSIRIWLTVIASTLLFGLFEFAVSRWLIEIHIAPNLHCSVQAIIVAVVAGFALWLILNGINDRRKLIEDELRRVAELNHTLRNALEVIVLAHHTVSDYEHKAIVLESTNRIDEKMRELFPVFGNTKILMKNGKWQISGKD
jgi:hypothetical protein